MCFHLILLFEKKFVKKEENFSHVKCSPQESNKIIQNKWGKVEGKEEFPVC